MPVIRGAEPVPVIRGAEPVPVIRGAEPALVIRVGERIGEESFLLAMKVFEPQCALLRRGAKLLAI